MPIDPSAVGARSEPTEHSWGSKDAILYALGVGAGTDELAFTTENTSDTPQRVLPTMAVVLGTGAETSVADSLRDHGQGIVATGSVRDLQRIVGRGAVGAVDIGRRVGCDTLVHAGPWIADPNLGFQAAADGRIRLLGAPLPAHIRVVGGAALADEPVHVGSLADIRNASICPCMDVMGAEVLDLLAAGMTHVEELKRQTSCGMGPCQGLPCWELLRGVLRKASDGRFGDDRPSHRGPRRGLTVAQAAGLHGLVEPQR